MKYIASCSFGKDSLAAIISRIEHGEPIDEAVYCRIMFDDETSAELPEHEEWIHGHAIPLLKSRYGIETEIVTGPHTYVSRFCKVVEAKTKNHGKIYGWPTLWTPWCNSDLKMLPIKRWQKTVGEYTAIVGIAADEAERQERKAMKGKILPLAVYGITEVEAFDICRQNDLLSPAYNGGRQRLGCWFCHNQRIGELRRLRKEHSHLWGRLMELDMQSSTTFKPDKTLRDYDERFSCEDAQLTIFDYLQEGANQ